MMLFLFVLMLVGRDSSDSVVEVLRGQRVAGAAPRHRVRGAAGRPRSAARSAHVPSVGLAAGDAGAGGNVTGIGALIFTKYLFAFELTSALLITAALGAMVLAYAQRASATPSVGQRATVEARLRGEHDRISPLPGPGVFATGNSVAVPALLPDGSSRPSRSRRSSTPRRPGGRAAPADAHALTGGGTAGRETARRHEVREGR